MKCSRLSMGRGLATLASPLMLLGVLALPVNAQDSRGARVIQALEAARADANRNLLESVMGLSLEGEATVQDLVLTSSLTRASLSSFVRGAEVVEENVSPGGTATVRLRLDLDRLARVTGREIEGKLRRIEAVGRAAVRVENQSEIESPEPAEEPRVRGEVAPGGAGLGPEAGEEPPQWSTVVTVLGNAAVKPREDQTTSQARLLAERAAIQDGYRRLLEYVYGVQVSAETTVEDLCLEDDRIRTRVDAYLRGARVETTGIDGDVAFAEVTLDLSGMPEVLR